MKLSDREINVTLDRYPACIVWTPLPVISWLFPFIGHTGICTSVGVIHDFAGDYFIGVDAFAFGEPHKFIPLKISLHDEAKLREYN